MNSKETGRRIRAHRKLLGMTQEDLAHSAGTSPSFIGHIERGTRNAGPDTLNAIARVLGVSCPVLTGNQSENAECLSGNTPGDELREDAAMYHDDETDFRRLMLREIIELLEDKD